MACLAKISRTVGKDIKNSRQWGMPVLSPQRIHVQNESFLWLVHQQELNTYHYKPFNSKWICQLQTEGRGGGGGERNKGLRISFSWLPHAPHKLSNSFSLLTTPSSDFYMYVHVHVHGIWYVQCMCSHHIKSTLWTKQKHQGNYPVIKWASNPSQKQLW